MRVTRSLYDMESYWISNSPYKSGAVCCWMNFVRQTSKRKRSDSDMRLAKRSGVCNMSSASDPLAVTLCSGETVEFDIVCAFFPSNSAIPPKTGFAILSPRISDSVNMPYGL